MTGSTDTKNRLISKTNINKDNLKIRYLDEKQHQFE